MGFGDNDHVIRGLMRFIEMTSREYIIEDVIRHGGTPNYKYQWLQTQRRFKFFYISNLSIGIPYYKGGHNKLAKVCNQVLNLIHIHPHMPSQDSQLIPIFTLTVLLGVAVPHPKRSTAAVEPRYYRDLIGRWGLGVFIPFPSLSNGSSSTSAQQTDAQ